MKRKDDKYYDNEVRKLKEEKKEVLGELKGDDYYGTSSDNRKRKSIKQEFKRKRRSIKRSEKQDVDQHIQNEIDRIYG